MFFKTLRNHRRLFVTVHQTLEADLRQFSLTMNRCKHLFNSTAQLVFYFSSRNIRNIQNFAYRMINLKYLPLKIRSFVS